MTGELTGRIAVVTGATSGIGWSAALALGRAGAEVVSVGRNADAAERLLGELARASIPAHFLPTDLSLPADVSGLVPRVVERCGRIDILVNNAAQPSVSSFLGTTTQEWSQLLAVNLTAPFLLMQAAGRQMIDQGGGGRIVNVTSSSAFRATDAPPAYAGAKAALTSLTRSAAAELGRHGINVNAVAPGPTATRMILGKFGSLKDLETAMNSGPMANLLNRVTTPEDAANVIVFLCTPASRQITAQTIHVSAGAIV